MGGVLLSLLLCRTLGILVTYTGVQDLVLGDWFAMFHADWCKHCTDVKPHFTSAAFSTPLRFLTIDCVTYHDLCVGHDVASFPTFMYLSNGEKTLYDGNYHTQAFIEYASKLLGPAVVHLSATTWQQQVASHTSAYTLAYISPKDDHMLAIFERTAESYKTQTMFFYAVPWLETKVISTTRDQNDYYEMADFTERDLQKFISTHRFPTLIEVASDNILTFKPVFRQKLLIVLAIETHDLESNYNVQKFLAEARVHKSRLRGYVQFCFLDLSASDTELEYLSYSSLPAVFAMRIEDDIPHTVQLEVPITKENVHIFVEDVIAGQLTLAPISPGVRHYYKVVERWTQGDSFTVDCAAVVMCVVTFAAAVLICKRSKQHRKSD